MIDWFIRQEQRQNDLERGVDADLVRANQRRTSMAFYLGGAAFGLYFLAKALPGVWRQILSMAAIICFLVGFFVGLWARLERGFLNQPETKEPPRLWK